MAEYDGADPTVHRRRLRSELRKARETCGKTQRETAGAMDWSMSKLIRIESGDVRVSTNDLRALLSYYEVTPERVGQLVDVARAAREPARWSRYRDVASPEFLTFLGYESSAAIIRNFEPTLIPGLLQTEEYARIVMSVDAEPQFAEGLVDLRIERQEILVRESPPDLHFAVDESVVRHVIGGPEVMRRQLRHLKELAEEPHIHIRLIRFERGMYPRMRTPYVIFEFQDADDEDVLYIENATGELIVRENQSVDDDQGPVGYMNTFLGLELLAPTEETVSILETAVQVLN